jgi:hypothetical protein
MNYAVSGLRSVDFTTHITDQLQQIGRALDMGFSDKAKEIMLSLLIGVDNAVREDLSVGKNPALTEWRLDQFNDWICREVMALKSLRKPKVPVFTPSNDFVEISPVPVEVWGWSRKRCRYSMIDTAACDVED